MMTKFIRQTKQVVVPGMAIIHSKEVPAMLEGALANVADMILNHVEVVVGYGNL